MCVCFGVAGKLKVVPCLGRLKINIADLQVKANMTPPNKAADRTRTDAEQHPPK